MRTAKQIKKRLKKVNSITEAYKIGYDDACLDIAFKQTYGGKNEQDSFK